MADVPIDTVTTDAGNRLHCRSASSSRTTSSARGRPSSSACILAIPHLIVVALWGFAAALVSIILWIALLFEGRAPASLQRFVATTSATPCR